jgi:DNA-binding IclR family transcriptional regulator
MIMLDLIKAIMDDRLERDHLIVLSLCAEGRTHITDLCEATGLEPQAAVNLVVDLRRLGYLPPESV